MTTPDRPAADRLIEAIEIFTAVVWEADPQIHSHVVVDYDRVMEIRALAEAARRERAEGDLPPPELVVLRERAARLEATLEALAWDADLIAAKPKALAYAQFVLGEDA